jgi:hypothetical protein
MPRFKLALTYEEKGDSVSAHSYSCGVPRKLALADAVKNSYLIALDHVYFPASDMSKKKAITSGGFRCHILTIHKKLDDAASARKN